MSLSTFTYTELDGSGRMSAEKGGKLKGERIFRVINYRDADDFLIALAGGLQNVGGTVVYNLPERFLPGSPLWCVGATAEGMGVPTGDSNGPNYDGGAKVVASYETLDYDPEQENNDQNPVPVVYATEQRSTRGQTLTLAAGQDENGDWPWEFVDGAGEQLSNDTFKIIKIIPQGEYSIVRHFVPTFPASTINGMVGKINNATFPTSSSAGGFATGTLLFLGDESTREYTTQGRKAWRITLMFSFNPNGWNKVYDPYGATPGYREIRPTGGTTERIYESANFMTLLS